MNKRIGISSGALALLLLSSCAQTGASMSPAFSASSTTSSDTSSSVSSTSSGLSDEEIEDDGQYFYNGFFGQHFNSFAPFKMLPSRFPKMKIEETSFLSNRGQKLIGYRCSNSSVTTPKGVVLVVHGLGIGGACNYFDIDNYLASQGFLAFTYDATANDKSEGDAVYGMGQGVVDLSYAIDYVKSDPMMSKTLQFYEAAKMSKLVMVDPLMPIVMKKTQARQLKENTMTKR